MRETILARLADIAQSHKVIILYACESGSRGWQFASQDSDYDVRFLYLHPLEWYLSIHRQRDVIEMPIIDGLDMVGWEWRKALQLFQRSNARLLEWQSSPIVYLPAHAVVQQLWALTPAYFSARVVGNHHIRSARQYLATAIQGERLHVKKIFYALRSVLILKWIEEMGAIHPMSIWKSVEQVIPSPELLQAVQDLFAAKQHSAEQALIPRMPILEGFCSREIQRLEPVIPSWSHQTGPDQPLNELLRSPLLGSLPGRQPAISLPNLHQK